MRAATCDRCATRRPFARVAEAGGAPALCVDCLDRYWTEQQTVAGFDLPRFFYLLAQPQPAEAPRPAEPPDAAAACPTCGATVDDLRRTGLLGCPDCYTVFARQVDQALWVLQGVQVERAQRG